ncbi:putative transmembrane protein (plasmid) [Sinorhizobium fredii CCBAU 25509]|nr:putative transmembrane protein [Sinorhizobium fredii CCBAU 83666]AWM29248.1 putative transmembrane protein [Sinorhizobium fredii CCBAU 25509]GEC35763.1 hypothetical protein EFR01_59340 [Sinorhizobium fredii]GLS07989.1 hypothetical protein GCM10007864_16170 [Sinorhizobium fredii]
MDLDMQIELFEQALIELNNDEDLVNRVLEVSLEKRGAGGAVPGIRFGLAFCEASGKRLVRLSGNDEAVIALARENALAIGAGHTFLIFLGGGFFPVNVLAAVRAVPEVSRIYCATANPTQVIVAQTELGRGVPGVVDGASPLGVETDADIAWRKDLCAISATNCSGLSLGI